MIDGLLIYATLVAAEPPDGSAVLPPPFSVVGSTAASVVLSVVLSFGRP